MHKWTYSEQGITTCTFECMHVSFLPKEHDITRALHNDMAVTRASGCDVNVKELQKGVCTWGGGSKFLILREHRA